MAALNQIQLRRGSESSWETANPTLTAGEPGFVTDSNRLKIGDGTTPWNDLDYISSESYSLVTTVFNNTGNPIPKMTAVYINGGQGDQPTVALAIATSDPTSAGTYGVTAEAISNMSLGKVIVFGSLHNLNTDQFNPTAPTGNVNGTTLYLSPTVAGGLTATKPSAPNHIVAIGTIIRTHQTEGIIEVRVQNGFELDELHDVAIGGVTGGEFLYYDGATSLWKANPNLLSSGSNIGVGISNPSSRLVVKGSGTTSATSSLNITNSSDSSLLFVRNDGKVGIGTASPQDLLNISGSQTTIRLNNSLSYDTQLRLIDSASDWSVGINQGNSLASGVFAIRSNTAGSNRFVIDASGRVGIGSTAPQAGFILDANGSAVIRGSIYLNNSLIEFNNSRFQLNAAATSTSHSWVCNGGANFGIGTSTPAARLSVAGSMDSGSSMNAVAIQTSIGSSSTNGLSNSALYINPTFSTSNSNVANIYGLLVSPSHAGTYTTTNSYGLYVNAASVTSGTITNNYSATFMGGNVGVGTASPSYLLDINGTTRSSIFRAGAGTTDALILQSNGTGSSSRTITLQPRSLAGTRTVHIPGENADVALTYNGSAITAGYTVNQSMGTIRNNLGDPSVEESALFHAEFFNQLRFISPSLQEESSDGGTTWATSTRMSAANLGDLMIGEGQGTNVNILPQGASSPIAYRLTWDTSVSSMGNGYFWFNHLYIYCSTNGNTVTFTIDAYHNTNGWTQIATGTTSNWPGHVSIKHNTIAYNVNNAGLYGKVRITFTSTTVSQPVQLYNIEWFGGYPAGRRNAESYDRNKNATFPAAINAVSGFRVNGSATSAQYLRGNGTNFVSSAIQAADVPTLNQNTTGSAATLTTTRTLWGQNFNGSANVIGKISSATDIEQSWGDHRIGMFYDNSYRLGMNFNSGGRILNIFSTTLGDGAGAITFSTRSGAGSSNTDYGTERVRILSNGNVGIGTASPGSTLEVNGQIRVSSANNTANGGGQLYLNGATGNRIDFNINGFAAPSFTTRSVGTKIVLYPAVNATNVDYAIGIDAGVLWNSVNLTTSSFKWYAATTNIATLDGTGVLTVAGSTSRINVDNLRLDGNTLSSTNTNGNIILSNDGTGALQRDSGGNARGANAVDLQKTRSVATQVASGQDSTIGGGQLNTSSAYVSTIAGGKFNTASGSYSVIGGGGSNTVTSLHSTIGGGNNNIINVTTANNYGGHTIGGGRNNIINDTNTASSYFYPNTIAGGYSNSCNASFYGASFVGGGRNNSNNGTYSVIGGGNENFINANMYNGTICGGHSNAIQSSYSTVCGGLNNIASNAGSSVLGGGSNTASGTYSSIIGGFNGKTRLLGEVAHAIGGFANKGDAQHSIFIVRRTTTDATANVVLTLDAATPGADNRLILPAKTTWSFEIKLSAYNDTDSAGAAWNITGGIRRNGANGTVLTGTNTTSSWAEGAMGSASVSVVADDTNEALEIRVTGIAAKNIRWVAVVDVSQVSYGTP